jgi:hypothetical protein
MDSLFTRTEHITVFGSCWWIDYGLGERREEQAHPIVRPAALAPSCCVQAGEHIGDVDG